MSFLFIFIIISITQVKPSVCQKVHILAAIFIQLSYLSTQSIHSHDHPLKILALQKQPQKSVILDITEKSVVVFFIHLFSQYYIINIYQSIAIINNITTQCYVYLLYYFSNYRDIHTIHSIPYYHLVLDFQSTKP